MARNSERGIGINTHLGYPYRTLGGMGIYTHKRNFGASKSREEDSGEVVLYGEARGRTPGTHSYLVVDGVEVPMDGAGTEEEPLGDLSVGEPFCHKP